MGFALQARRRALEERGVPPLQGRRRGAHDADGDGRTTRVPGAGGTCLAPDPTLRRSAPISKSGHACRREPYNGGFPTLSAARSLRPLAFHHARRRRQARPCAYSRPFGEKTKRLLRMPGRQTQHGRWIAPDGPRAGAKGRPLGDLRGVRSDATHTAKQAPSTRSVRCRGTASAPMRSSSPVARRNPGATSGS